MVIFVGIGLAVAAVDADIAYAFVLEVENAWLSGLETGNQAIDDIFFDQVEGSDTLRGDLLEMFSIAYCNHLLHCITNASFLDHEHGCHAILLLQESIFDFCCSTSPSRHVLIDDNTHFLVFLVDWL